MQVAYNYIDYKNSFMCFSQKSQICHLKNATPPLLKFSNECIQSSFRPTLPRIGARFPQHVFQGRA
jgi:hypothetical protein